MSKVTPVEFAKALADETRQKIMQACCCHWRSVNELVEEMDGITQPTVSHHLAVLKEVGLVDVRHEGKQTFYTLNQSRMVACCGQLMVTFAPQEKATAAVSKVVA